MANVKNPLNEESSSPTELQPRIISIAIDLSILESKQFSGSTKLAYIGALIAQSQGFSPNARGFPTRVAQAIGGWSGKVTNYLKEFGSNWPIGHIAPDPNWPIGHIAPDPINESRARTHATPQETRQDQTRLIQSASSAAPQPRSLEEVQSLWPNYFSPLKVPKPEETASARARATLGIKTTAFEGLAAWFKLNDQDPSEKPCNLAKLFKLVDEKFGKEAGPQVLSIMVAYLTLHNQATSKKRGKPQNVDYCFPYLTTVVGVWAKDGAKEEDAISELEIAHKKERNSSNGKRNDVHNNRPSDDGDEEETSTTNIENGSYWQALAKRKRAEIQGKTG